MVRLWLILCKMSCKKRESSDHVKWSLTQSRRGGPAPPISHCTSWEACGSWAHAETETTSAYSSLFYANCSLRQQEMAKVKASTEPTP